MDTTIIIPYIFYDETEQLREALGWKLNYIMENDEKRIGSDMMYQKLWKQCPDTDVIILHPDMAPKDFENDKWYFDLKEYVDKYPEAGMFGCKLIYPLKSSEDNHYIQCAGGKFTDNKPDHFGSGLDIFSGKRFKEPEEDKGQYDFVREVAWTTFGGLYIRRDVIKDVGDFNPSFEWTYNRDVDYCLQAREKGWKIYQVPIPIFHFEAKDNKRIRGDNPELNAKENRNLERLQDIWRDSPLYETIDRKIENE